MNIHNDRGSLMQKTVPDVKCFQSMSIRSSVRKRTFKISFFFYITQKRTDSQCSLKMYTNTCINRDITQLLKHFGSNKIRKL